MTYYVITDQSGAAAYTAQKPAQYAFETGSLPNMPFVPHGFIAVLRADIENKTLYYELAAPAGQSGETYDEIAAALREGVQSVG